jgi:hypothetical protein
MSAQPIRRWDETALLYGPRVSIISFCFTRRRNPVYGDRHQHCTPGV